MLEALVWPQRRHYKKTSAGSSESIKRTSRAMYYSTERNRPLFRAGIRTEESADIYGAWAGTDNR